MYGCELLRIGVYCESYRIRATAHHWRQDFPSFCRDRRNDHCHTYSDPCPKCAASWASCPCGKRLHCAVMPRLCSVASMSTKGDCIYLGSTQPTIVSVKVASIADASSVDDAASRDGAGAALILVATERHPLSRRGRRTNRSRGALAVPYEYRVGAHRCLLAGLIRQDGATYRCPSLQIQTTAGSDRTGSSQLHAICVICIIRRVFYIIHASPCINLFFF